MLHEYCQRGGAEVLWTNVTETAEQSEERSLRNHISLSAATTKLLPFHRLTLNR
jgi:hypothetical protein